MIYPVTARSGLERFYFACERRVSRIKEIALKVLHALGDALQCAKRYSGSKSTCGYCFEDRTEMCPKELYEKMDLVCSCAFVHGCNPEWIEPFGYSIETPASFSEMDQRMEPRERCFFDPKSGLKATVARKGDAYVITFGAKGSNRSEIPHGGGSGHRLVALSVFFPR